ncbi:Hypothetical protein CINCED_3A011314 [Cinara cedri]|uniref:Uncharacterized protein n=1 Tax=Cinara cedri TaxID=506608 RepID=A0A5E4NG21_9HEMI|nr:Hypothetical protein CINCED_3A011314 [Cinara cedri]
MTTGFNLIENNTVSHYILEVFIGGYNFTGNTQTSDKISDQSKNEEANLKTKYIIKLILDGVLDTEIAGYDKGEEEKEEGHKDECATYFNDQLDLNIDEISRQYNVEKPVCNAYTVCYNIANKDKNDEYMSMQPTMNKGVICIFACVPKTLITLLQRNPFEIMVCEKTESDEKVFGIISLSLSGAMGFTDAIAYHFYEKGYSMHSHTSEHLCDVRSIDGTQSVGDIFVRFKLTCCGPKAKEVNQIWLKLNDRSSQQDPRTTLLAIAKDKLQQDIEQVQRKLNHHLKEQEYQRYKTRNINDVDTKIIMELTKRGLDIDPLKTKISKNDTQWVTWISEKTNSVEITTPSFDDTIQIAPSIFEPVQHAAPTTSGAGSPEDINNDDECYKILDRVDDLSDSDVNFFFESIKKR